MTALSGRNLYYQSGVNIIPSNGGPWTGLAVHRSHELGPTRLVVVIHGRRPKLHPFLYPLTIPRPVLQPFVWFESRFKLHHELF